MPNKIEGVEELQKALRVLGPKMGGSTLRSALRRAAKPVLDQAKSKIPVGKYPHKTYKGRIVSPGFSQRSVKMSAKLSRDKRTATVSIGVQREAFYAVQFVELGTSKMPRRPWLRPALAAQRNNANNLLRRELKRQLELASKRLARKLK